jgi:threonine dehydrogenase-like Zn-dependent dehydrogenase
MAARAVGASPAIRDIAADKRDRSRPFRRRIHAEWSEPSDGRRFDAAVNAAPAMSAFIDGLKRLSSGGRFCLFSGLTDGGTVDAAILNEIHYRQLSITGAYGCTAPQMAQALDILAGHATEAEMLIEDRVPLEAVPAILPDLLSGNRFKFIVDLCRS